MAPISPFFENLHANLVKTQAIPDEECSMLVRERLLRALMYLGLKELDSEVYLHLAMKGPQKGKDVAEVLNLHVRQLHKSLKRLEGKGMVISNFEHPSRFSAVSLEKIIEFMIKAKKEQVLALRESKDELLSTWRAIAKDAADN